MHGITLLLFILYPSFCAYITVYFAFFTIKHQQSQTGVKGFVRVEKLTKKNAAFEGFVSGLMLAVMPT